MEATTVSFFNLLLTLSVQTMVFTSKMDSEYHGPESSSSLSLTKADTGYHQKHSSGSWGNYPFNTRKYFRGIENATAAQEIDGLKRYNLTNHKPSHHYLDLSTSGSASHGDNILSYGSKKYDITKWKHFPLRRNYYTGFGWSDKAYATKKRVNKKSSATKRQREYMNQD